ncbi:alpha-amylase family glycosyl hydrolase [Pseudoxanthomonas sp. SL93]|uniref:alpha-amylase family glycosyl hydrolase n=1 Tax=Pseudoxanthomonas sp. SL93 TaxID=2995142 RepID=UPI002270E153|nr:alpha-amylase family glycosyl hydrolase [Pseudoxanthomonas sp. SL93]WAC64391.1 alpha-amylase family glycosyl hydrolase [Pseudoxanthomonas sp. SL93]
MMRATLKPLPVLLLLAMAAPRALAADDFYGTKEPFAKESVYFVLTDRFVNGDPSNDHRDQGGAHRTFDLPVPGAPEGQSDNVGYLGGDFRGVVNNAGYIRDLGFTSVWVTPIVDNPDQAFTGGEAIKWGGMFTDRGKTGYHGYWGINFYKLDEHLPSEGLDFAGFTRAMKEQKLDVVLDIVTNHGSPAYSMPTMQPQYGKLWDRDGTLVADHQNLDPDRLDPRRKRLHAFYNTQGGLAQLSDFNEHNPAVLEYLAGAYEQWIDQGAAAFRVDTIAWMPHAFWKRFADRMRQKRPGFFMFGENFNYDAASIAGHTWQRNGAYSVLDFPLKAKLVEVFEKPGSDFAELGKALYLEDGPYANPYDLMTFYDNHDMARMNASDEGFIDAHHWLFTARGIPVIYYGSETGFMRGTAEHAGNRNYFGQDRIDAAPGSPIFAPLRRIAQLRRDTPALQRGLQLNVRLKGDQAVFYRVLQHEGINQTALVMLNKGDKATRVSVSDYLQQGEWRDAFTGRAQRVRNRLEADVPAHGVRVFLLDAPVTRADTRARLAELMERKSPKAD